MVSHSLRPLIFPCTTSSLVPIPIVKYKRTRQRMRVCREKGLVNNYGYIYASQEFLLMVISKWLRPHRVHEYRLENLISPKRNALPLQAHPASCHTNTFSRIPALARQTPPLFMNLREASIYPVGREANTSLPEMKLFTTSFCQV